MEVAMVGDGQVKELRRLLSSGRTLAASARMTEMSEKTARDYRDDDRLPSTRKQPRNYRTRTDPFAVVWDEVQQRLQDEPRLKAKTLFAWLQTSRPGEFPDSTRRTFERRVSQWRALHGPNKPVFFSQEHQPGRLAASDFTVCNELGVKIAGMRFEHTLFHCVLTYSNLESVSLCFSESFEALSTGIQKAFFEFGGVPQRHRTDSLSAAINNHSSRKSHTARYTALMEHYRCDPERTNARCANENGDVESSNGHLKDRLDQALLLRGSRDFASRADYMIFVEEVIATANANRQSRYAEEVLQLKRLPDHRLDVADLLSGIRVSSSSTIQVRTNTYSVPSRLIGRKVDVRIEAETIEVTYQDHSIQTMPRLYGKKGVSINYRHVIDSLVRKPGAFANYRFREEMFPTSQFRIAYDILLDAHSAKVADKTYVKLLELAARQSQAAVADALRLMIATGSAIDIEQVGRLVEDAANLPPATELEVEVPDLSTFDSLLTMFDKEVNTDEQNENQIHVGEISSGFGAKPAAGKPQHSVDRTIPRTADAGLPGSLRPNGNARRSGEPESSGLPGGIDDPGMRGSAGGSNQAATDTFQAAAGQDLGVFRFQTLAAGGESPNGDVAGRFVFGSPRERVAVWQAGFGQEPSVVCVGPAVDPPRTQPAVYDLQHVGSAVVDCQAGSAVAEVAQAVGELRGIDHRRPGVRAAEPRGNGGTIYATGRSLRTRQRVADEQSGVQQVGPDLQGRDDDSGSDRSVGSSQRDHRVERAELPSRNGQTEQIEVTIESEYQDPSNFMMGNSNCR